MKIVKSLEESGLLIEFVSETIKNEAKKQEGMLLGTLGASLLGNLLKDKGVKQPKILGQEVITAGEDTIRTG